MACIEKKKISMLMMQPQFPLFLPLYEIVDLGE